MKRLFQYLKNVKAELKKISWPSKKKTQELTTVVVIITVVWAVYVWALDTGFTQLMTLLLK